MYYSLMDYYCIKTGMNSRTPVPPAVTAQGSLEPKCNWAGNMSTCFVGISSQDKLLKRSRYLKSSETMDYQFSS